VIGVIVLAAGSSSRMGMPKLLLRLQGKSLVRRVVEEAVASRARQTVVVTGAHGGQVQRELGGLPVKLVDNPEYGRGMSTSVAAGLGALAPEAQAAAIVLADQPLVDRTVLDRLIEVYERSDGPIVQPRYGGQPGNPVLWDRQFFGELMSQTGDQGGRELLRRHADKIVWCEIADAHIGRDVDTPADYDGLRATVETAPDQSHRHDQNAARFCPQCGGHLREEVVQGRSRPVCEGCGSVFWVDPKVAVAVLIPWEQGVLLGRRAIDPGMGLWSFPSGYVDRGEVLEEAACREVLEETGLDVKITGLVGVYSQRDKAVVLVAYAAEVTGGNAHPGPEVSELAGFPPDRLPSMAFSQDDEILRDWLKLRGVQATR
jgi:8-oxo-dGTP diphosphatase